MAKRNNLKLAEQIVDQHAEIKQHENEPKFMMVRIPIIGFTGEFHNVKKEKGMVDADGNTPTFDVPTRTTKADAKKMAAQHLAKLLDDGSLVLSDTWSEDNLKAK